MRVAAIDVGTNSIHLLVADLQPDGSMQFVEKDRRQVMLGKGSLETNRLQPDAIERAMDALKSFKEASDSLGAEDIYAAATSAVREADNGAEFCRMVRREVGIHIHVISGSDEARMIYLGTRRDLDFRQGPVLLFDVGGGSTEFIVGDGSIKPRFHRSLHMGHIRLTEKFRTKKALTRIEARAMKREIDDLLLPILPTIRSLSPTQLVGTSGTVRTLAKMCTLHRGESLPEHGNGLVLDLRSLEDLIESMIGASQRSLLKLRGFDERRLNTLPAGALLVRQVLKHSGFSQLVTSDCSLRDGLLADWVNQNRPELLLSGVLEDPRERTTRLAQEHFGANRPHAEQVCRLALQLFDGTREFHHLGEPERDLLYHGALLHDIGHHISGRSHHKHGEYLLQHIRMPGFNAREVSILSNLVRYHSRSLPKDHHRNFAALSPEDQDQVKTLAALLRVADALDRSHNQPVTQLLITPTAEEGLKIHATTKFGGEQEEWGTRSRLTFLEKRLGIPLELEVTSGQ